MGVFWLFNGGVLLDNFGGFIGISWGNILKGFDFIVDIDGIKIFLVCGNDIMGCLYGCGG